MPKKSIRKTELNLTQKIALLIRQNYLLIIIFICAIFLRFYRLADFAMFLSDQGRDAIIIKRIITLEHLPAIGAPSSLGGVYLGPFYYYLISPFLLLFNFNPVGLAFGVALLSMVGLIGVIRVTRKEIDEKTAILTAFFISFSYILIYQSRFSWNPNLVPFFSFFSLYFLYKFLDTKKNIDAVLLGIFLGLSIQLHHLTIFLGIISFLFLSLYFYLSKNKFAFIKAISLSIAAFIITVSPLMVFDLRHNFLNSRNLMKLITGEGIVSNTSYLTKLTNTLTVFISQSIGYGRVDNLNLLTFILLIILVGLWLLLDKKTNLLLKINYVNVVGYLLFFSLINSSRHGHYYNNIYISFYLILGYIVIRSTKYLNTIQKKGFIILIISGFLYLSLPKMSYIFGQSWDQISHAQKTANFLADKIDQKPFNIATWPVEFFEDQYLYFLELKDLRPEDRAKSEVTDQMFVLCAKEPCQIINSPSWNISMFGRAKIDKIWQVDQLIIYKLVH